MSLTITGTVLMEQVITASGREWEKTQVELNSFVYTG